MSTTWINLANGDPKLVCIITIFVKLGLFGQFEIVANIRTWINPHKYWRML